MSDGLASDCLSPRTGTTASSAWRARPHGRQVGSRARPASHRRTNIEPGLYRSPTPRWSRLPRCRLPLRQELHKLRTPADSLPVRTSSGSTDAGSSTPKADCPKSSGGEAPSGELPVVRSWRPVMPSTQLVDHPAAATTRSTRLLQPWRTRSLRLDQSSSATTLGSFAPSGLRIVRAIQSSHRARRDC
jgi:hypothetical protein